MILFDLFFKIKAIEIDIQFLRGSWNEFLGYKERKFIICKEKCAGSSINGIQPKSVRYVGMCLMHDTQETVEKITLMD